MRTVPGWDHYYLTIAEVAKFRSKDPNTQVGAVVVNSDNRIVSLGYNGMPEGCAEEHLWADKDDYVVHAEVNALSNVARIGASSLGGTVYITLPPCIGCARSVIAAGIKRVVFSGDNMLERFKIRPGFRESTEKSLAFLVQSGVEVRIV